MLAQHLTGGSNTSETTEEHDTHFGAWQSAEAELRTAKFKCPRQALDAGFQAWGLTYALLLAQEGTRADGAKEEQVRKCVARQSAEAELRAAEAECARQRSQVGAPSPEALARQDAAEQALEAALGEDLDSFAEE